MGRKWGENKEKIGGMGKNMVKWGNGAETGKKQRENRRKLGENCGKNAGEIGWEWGGAKLWK